MTHLIAILIAAALLQSDAFDQGVSDKNFELVDDFIKNKTAFRDEQIELDGQSTQGGQLVIFRHKDKSYLVVDIWLFGEMGRINTTYWLDKDLKFLIVRNTEFAYDKPFYEKDFKVTESTSYVSYNSGKVNVYDHKRRPLDDDRVGELKSEVEEFFAEMTKGRRIIK